MPKKLSDPSPKETPTIDLGIGGWRAPLHSHIAYLWKTDEDFDRAMGFVEIGLRGSDHCVVIGDQRDRMFDVLERGIDLRDRRIQKRLTVIDRFSSPEKMIEKTGEAVDSAVAAGARIVRVAGNPPWDRESGPSNAELYVTEASFTDFALRHPCVVLCLHELNALSGAALHHGVLGTHPRVLEGDAGNNPFFVLSDGLGGARLGETAAQLSRAQGIHEESRRQVEVLQAIFDNIPVMISSYDPSGKLLLVNREWERVLGWSLEEALKIDLLAEAYPDPEERRKTREFIQKGEKRWQDFRTRTRDGRIIDTSWMRIALSNGARLGFGLDVTERKRAEEESRQAARRLQELSDRKEDHLRLVINTIPTMAWSVLPEGRVDFLSQRWLDYSGLSLQQYVANPTGPIHPEDIPRAIEKWERAVASGQPYEDEMRLRRADGEYRWFLVRTVPLHDEQGTIVKWYGTSTDIEDRKQAEEKLRATSEQLRALSAKLQSAREDVSTRIARAVHDEVGQALAALGMDVAWVSKNLGRSGARAALSAKLQSMGRLLESTAETVQRIASDLRPSLLDNLGLEAAVDWAVTGFQERTGITCRLEERLDGEQIEPSRATAIFRILQEALTNIARHARAKQVAVLLVRRDGELLLEVEDDGIGIEDARIDDFRSLGLLGMRERARTFGGDVEIAHRTPSGTALSARIPL